MSSYNNGVIILLLFIDLTSLTNISETELSVIVHIMTRQSLDTCNIPNNTGTVLQKDSQNRHLQFACGTLETTDTENSIKGKILYLFTKSLHNFPLFTDDTANFLQKQKYYKNLQT
jgi:hypothetical protein